MTDTILVENLEKRYRATLPGRPGRTAIEGFNLRVPSGGITGLLGPNGSGKSTAIKVLLGLIKPTSGNALVLGRDSWRESLRIREDIAYVPAERTVLEWMRVRRFIEGVASLSKKWDAQYASRLMRKWEIDENAALDELSTGARSKLLLIAALARRTQILVLDEPTTGLDPRVIDDALAELVSASADGTTILLVSHHIDVVDRICDRVTIMSRGRAVLTSDLDDLRSSWAVIEVVGHPQPDAMEKWEETASVTHHPDHSTLVVRSSPAHAVERIRSDGARVLSLRPLTLRDVYRQVTPASDIEEDLPDADTNHLA